MKLALSSAGMPARGVEEWAKRAREMGADGVELECGVEEIEEAGRGVRNEELEVACLGTGARFMGNRINDGVSAGVVRAGIEAAGGMGCRVVRMLDIGTRRAGEKEILQFAGYLRELGDHALRHGVTLAVENALTLRTARAMWELMELTGHPAVGVCWNGLSAQKVGERAAVSVPTLNGKIRHVRISAGENHVRELVQRLRGIGYEGFVAVEGEEMLRKVRMFREEQGMNGGGRQGG